MIHTYAQASGNLFAGNSKARLFPSFFGEIQSFFFVENQKRVYFHRTFFLPGYFIS